MQGLYWMAFCTVYNFVAYVLTYRGFNEAFIGILLAGANVLALVVQVPLASWADKEGKGKLKKILLFFTFLNILLSLGVIAGKNNPMVTAIFLFGVLAFVLTMHSFVNTLAMEYVNAGYNINFSLARAIGSLGAALAPLALGFLSNIYGPLIIAFTHLGLFILLFILILFFKPVDRKETGFEALEDVKKEEARYSKVGFITFFKRYKKFTGLLAGTILTFSAYNMAINFLIKVTNALGKTEKEMGITLFIAAILEVPGMIIYMVLSKKMKSSSLLKISAFFFVIKSLGIYLATNITGLYAAHFAQLLSFAIFAPATVFYINELMDAKDRVKGQTYMTATITMGGIFGSLLGGYLIDQFYVKYMLLVALVIAIVGSFLMIVFTENEKKPVI